jgi:four helix bundle suffix protein
MVDLRRYRSDAAHKYYCSGVYKDFAATLLCDQNSVEALAVRTHYQSDKSDMADRSDPYSLKTASPEVAANTLICLINQASYLLGRQLKQLEQQFLIEGGFTERLYKMRTQARKKQ